MQVGQAGLIGELPGFTVPPTGGKLAEWGTPADPMKNPTTDIVLATVIADWHVRLPRLAEHLTEQFGYVVTHPMAVERLIICEQADGTVIPENIGHLFLRKWVVLGRSDPREVSVGFSQKEMYDTDDSGVIYVSPSFLFCCQDDMVLLSERYGCGLKHRLRGRVVDDGIQWTTLWKSGAS